MAMNRASAISPLVFLCQGSAKDRGPSPLARDFGARLGRRAGGSTSAISPRVLRWVGSIKAKTNRRTHRTGFKVSRARFHVRGFTFQGFRFRGGGASHRSDNESRSATKDTKEHKGMATAARAQKYRKSERRAQGPPH